MTWLKAILVTVGPRLLSVLASVLVAKAAEKGVTLDPIETTALMVGTYATIHKAVSSKVNPGDAAKLRMATAQKTASDDGGTVTVSRRD